MTKRPPFAARPIPRNQGWVFYYARHFPRAAALLVVASFSVRPALAQAPADVRSYEVRRITFHGNRSASDGDLRETISSRETPGAVAQFFYRTFGEKFGGKPEQFDENTLLDDTKRIESFYHDRGYFNVADTGSYTADTAHRTVDIVFSIREGERSGIDTIDYRGLGRMTPELREDLLAEPLVREHTYYEKQNVDGEITRVLDFLVNHGYPMARFHYDSSGAEHRASTNNFRLNYAFIMGKEFHFGDVTVHVDPPRPDITDHLVLRELDFGVGETYSRDKMTSSSSNLNRLDLFESARVEHRPLSDTMTASVVPVEVFVTPRTRHEISPELTVSDENNAFNLATGLGYTGRNFLGDARILNAHARIRTQSIQEWNFHEVFHGAGFRDPSVVGAAELQIQILQPYFFTRTLSGTITSTISAEKQQPYILSIFRNKLGLSNRFATYTYGAMEWTLERVRPEILAERDTISAQLRQEDQPQFNSILTLTMQRDKTNDIFSPTDGFFNSITLEESGVLPKMLPGIVSGLPFTQYYKVVLFGRWYQDLSRTKYDILALKAKAGYQDKYGESRSEPVNIPLNRRFFGGGSGSVRGWKARDLGAMPDSLLQYGGNFVLEGNCEFRVNYFRGFGKLLGVRLDNIWGVYFFDAGNVWADVMDFKVREIAVAAGIGIRYETFFGPFRVDYGFRVYDPKEVAGKQVIVQKRFFAETLGNGVFHFGIGHAF